MKKNKFLFFLIFLFLICNSFYCDSDQDNTKNNEGEVESPQQIQTCQEDYNTQQMLFTDSKSIWKTEKVSVCWLNPESYSQSDLDLAKNTIKDSWDKYIDLDFVGWEKCTNTLTQIKILISDERPRSVVGARYYLDHGYQNMQWTMILNFEYKNWSEVCSKNSNQRLACLRRNVMHEFGHAIGFQHEQYRFDTPDWCSKLLDEEDKASSDEYYGDILYGKWDNKSIMNYCSYAHQLSCNDINGAISIYGPENDE